MENLPGITTKILFNEQVIAFYKSYYNSKIAARVILATNRLECFFQNILLVEVNKNINLSRCVYEINHVIDDEKMRDIVISNFIGFNVTDKDLNYTMDIDIARLYKILYSKKLTATEKKLAEKKNISIYGVKGILFTKIARYQLHLMLREVQTNQGVTPYGRELRQCLETIHEQLQNI